MGRTRAAKSQRDVAREVPMVMIPSQPQDSLLSVRNPTSAPEPVKKSKPKSFSTAMSKRKRIEKQKAMEHSAKLEMKIEKRSSKREGKKKAKAVWD